MNKRFIDKIALITGASRGIGKATALAFAHEGAKVVVNFNHNEKAASEVVDEINNVSEAIAVKADVSEPEQVQELVDQAIKRFGHIDILVNNAGIVLDIPFKEKTLEQWRQTIAVNLVGPYICAKAVLPHMQEGGSIINITSTNGISTYHPDSMDYDASKAGEIIFTKALAQELAPKIRVNAVSPGWIDTDMNKGLLADFLEEEKSKAALKRFGQPEEIAAVVLFVASDEASFMTGANLVADGGYR